METNARAFTLKKAERLHKKKLIDRLFTSGSKSMLAFPLRMVYLPVEPEASPERVAMMISVPKKRLHSAVKRNRVKRQIREAYRQNKYTLIDKAEEKDQHLILAFIWLSNELHSSTLIQTRIANLLTRLSEKLNQ